MHALFPLCQRSGIILQGNSFSLLRKTCKQHGSWTSCLLLKSVTPKHLVTWKEVLILLTSELSLGYSLIWASTCSGICSSTDCKWTSIPRLTFMGCRGTGCLTMVFSTGCIRISALGAWSTWLPTTPTPLPSPPLPPFFPDFWCLKSCFSHILTPLFSFSWGCTVTFSP